MDTLEIATSRYNKVVKSNTLIQQSRHQFSVQQQKVLLYLISQIKPDQTEFEWQTFSIPEFCRTCGIAASGGNYKDLKDSLQGLRDKSMWLRTPDGEETLVGWLQKVKIADNSGKVRIKLDEDMKPFLLELKERFTTFDLRYTLAMRSKYSVRLYEILKSYANLNEPVTFDLIRFKNMVGTEYERWVDVKRYVIETALAEINEVSDLDVSYIAKKKGRSFNTIVFNIKIKKGWESTLEMERNIYARLE